MAWPSVVRCLRLASTLDDPPAGASLSVGNAASGGVVVVSRLNGAATGVALRVCAITGAEGAAAEGGRRAPQ